jgi:rhodanese-related sulfurtransferase
MTPGMLLRLSKADFEELLRPSVVREVTPEQALEMVNGQSAVWLDCRYDKEYEESRIPGTLFAPLDQIRGDIIKLDPDKTYVVYCRSGRRSKAAAFLLRGRHINAVSLQGGIKSWPYAVDMSAL